MPMDMHLRRTCYPQSHSLSGQKRAYSGGTDSVVDALVEVGKEEIVFTQSLENQIGRLAVKSDWPLG